MSYSDTERHTQTQNVILRHRLSYSDTTPWFKGALIVLRVTLRIHNAGPYTCKQENAIDV